MHVIIDHGIESSLRLTNVKPADLSARRELFEVPIYCSEADPRESRFDHLKNFIRRRMGFHLAQLFKDNPLLPCHPVLYLAHIITGKPGK